MGSNTIIAIVVGAILVIVGFALWPVLNGASNSLYSYFQNSCDDGNGNRFGKAYLGSSVDTLPSPLVSTTYYSALRVHGGSGVDLAADGNNNCIATLSGWASTTADYYNEQGEKIGNLVAPSTGINNHRGSFHLR